MTNGNVGRCLRRIERRKTDKEFKEKSYKINRDWYIKNKEKAVKKNKEWVLTLSKFRNKKCLDCGKILHYKTKGDYCNKHFQKHFKGKIINL